MNINELHQYLNKITKTQKVLPYDEGYHAFDQTYIDEHTYKYQELSPEQAKEYCQQLLDSGSARDITLVAKLANEKYVPFRIHLENGLDTIANNLVSEHYRADPEAWEKSFVRNIEKILDKETATVIMDHILEMVIKEKNQSNLLSLFLQTPTEILEDINLKEKLNDFYKKNPQALDFLHEKNFLKHLPLLNQDNLKTFLDSSEKTLGFSQFYDLSQELSKTAKFSPEQKAAVKDSVVSYSSKVVTNKLRSQANFDTFLLAIKNKSITLNDLCDTQHPGKLSEQGTSFIEKLANAAITDEQKQHLILAIIRTAYPPQRGSLVSCLSLGFIKDKSDQTAEAKIDRTLKNAALPLDEKIDHIIDILNKKNNSLSPENIDKQRATLALVAHFKAYLQENHERKNKDLKDLSDDSFVDISSGPHQGPGAP